MFKAFWVGLAAALFVAAPAAAQTTPLFDAETPIQITIDAPFNQLVRAAPRSTNPFPASLRVTAGAPAQTFAIQLAPRGLTRRTAEDVCNFPPLAINFDRSDRLSAARFSTARTG